MTVESSRRTELPEGACLIRGLQGLRRARPGGAATIGNFDGVHRGHQAMIDRVRDEAAARGGPATVVTFEPHPLEYFRGADAPPRITGWREKVLRLFETGVDQVVCLPFRAALAQQEPEAFVDAVLVDGLGAGYVLIGDDFRFGRQRRGDVRLLQDLAESRGFQVGQMPTVTDPERGAGRISSSRIREQLGAGDFDGAARLLGTRFQVAGRVVHGDAVGRELGWPTINLRLPPSPPPLAGIYSAWVHGVGAVPWPAALSVGTRPTVGGTKTVFEAYLLDFDGDLYGRHVRVEPVEWLRGEEDFPGLDALSEQIGRDVALVRERLGGAPGIGARSR